MTKSKKRQRGASNRLVDDVGSSKQEQNLDALLEEAESAIDRFSYEEAAQKLKNVLNIDSNNLKALEMLAGIYLDEPNWDEAANLFKQCISISPDIGYSKYFSMGQLTSGEESLTYYQKGIEILQKELENCENIKPSEEEDRKILSKNLSDAYCSVAEIFMTDCCDAENAEQQCHSAIENAIQSNTSNPEAYQCLANFYIVKKNFLKEAKEAIEKSLALWLPHHEALRDADAETVFNIELLIPSYDSRIQTSKLLIELEMFEQATNILDGLVDEDDEVPEVWYILGWMNYMQSDEYKLNAHYYLKKATMVSAKLGMDDLDCISHAHELLKELEEKYPSLKEEVYEDDKEWSDVPSDSEDSEMET
ncbi:probable assembly chaperone of rpl4 [Trichonephila inaurata madagascariensis]|uniref:Probable assembly chaperone of rpl4 n=1 Tax=Trichonephila inaurata madagascariensis TaxID=2747483 RepID=A0A8X7CNC0_9ARAC|nr:probable assembly chaperone of rpl4 [Trichonephila inaurata madagascariensis]